MIDYEQPTNKETMKKKTQKKTPVKGISEKTLKMMDKAVDNFKKGKVSKPIDLSRTRHFLTGC